MNDTCPLGSRYTMPRRFVRIISLKAFTYVFFTYFDPLPTKLIPSFSEAERLRLSFPEAAVVLNRMNRGVHKAELRRFLGAGKAAEIPALPAEAVYKAEYNCVPVYSSAEIKKLLAGPCRELVKQLGL